MVEELQLRWPVIVACGCTTAFLSALPVQAAHARPTRTPPINPAYILIAAAEQAPHAERRWLLPDIPDRFEGEAQGPRLKWTGRKLKMRVPIRTP